MTLSDRLQSLAAASSKPPETVDGREYIEEVKGFGGVKYNCSLCHVCFEPNLKDNHIKQDSHKEAYKIQKEKGSVEEQLVLGKHEGLSPTEEEFQAVRDIVLSCEKALKLVSDVLSQEESPSQAGNDGVLADVIIKQENTDVATGDKVADPGDAVEEVRPRSIKGVMRAGLLANGLLMKGEVSVHLVLLSRDKPTCALLSRVTDILLKQLATITEDKYEIVMQPENACILVTSTKSPKAMCKISLTSQSMRRHPFDYYNDIAPPDPVDVLPRKACEDALRELRRARWFEAKAYSLPFCEIVMRIFRELCSRIPTLSRMDIWLLELIVQKCLSTLDSNATAASAVQRVFECIAGGIFLPDNPGVYDPCEREPTDLCTKLTIQEREDMTASAQHALRLLAFQQMHKILDITLDDLSSDGKSGNKRKRSEVEAAETTQAKKDKADPGKIPK